MRRLPLVVLALSACVPQGFTGDAGTIFFVTPLSRDYQSFSPWQPVAQGTHLAFKADQVMPYALVSPRAPRAMPAASGPALAQQSGQLDQWTGWAAAPGKGTVSWSGVVSDGFELTVAPARSIELADPLAVYADEGYTPRHPFFKEVGHEVVVAPGQWIYFELVPRSEGGVALAFEPGWIAVEGGGRFAVDAGGHGVNIVAPAAGPATSTFTLSAGDSGVSETFTLVTPADPAAEVARLTLEAVPTFLNEDQTGYFVLVATAYRADGGVLWVPPLEWQLPADSFDIQTKNSSGVQIELPRRNDVRAIGLRSGPATASVSYAGLDASVTITPAGQGAVDGGTGQPPGPPGPGPGCLGCSSGGGALAVLALAFLLGVRKKPL